MAGGDNRPTGRADVILVILDELTILDEMIYKGAKVVIPRENH